MERKLASIQKIEEVQPIEGADRIVKVRVHDWWIVTQKDNNFVPGTRVVFFEIDCFLPDLPVYEFLKKGSTLKRMNVLGEVKHGIRLKTIKLKGQISQGLVLPLSAFEGNILDSLDVGTDITTVLGVLKYEPPMPAELAGIAKGMFPSFLPKTDEERIQNMGEVLANYYVTEKLDGTSVTYYKKDGVFGVCSRNLELKDNDGTQWKLARVMGLPDKLPDNFALQGELVGEGIQGNPLRITGQQVYFFNVYKIMENATYKDDGMYLDYENLRDFLTGMGLAMVPVVNENFSLPGTVEDMLKLADGASLINPNVAREGLVVRPKHEMQFKGQRLSFKAISNEYLLGEK